MPQIYVVYKNDVVYSVWRNRGDAVREALAVNERKLSSLQSSMKVGDTIEVRTHDGLSITIDIFDLN